MGPTRSHSPTRHLPLSSMPRTHEQIFHTGAELGPSSNVDRDAVLERLEHLDIPCIVELQRRPVGELVAFPEAWVTRTCASRSNAIRDACRVGSEWAREPALTRLDVDRVIVVVDAPRALQPRYIEPLRWDDELAGGAGWVLVVRHPGTYWHVGVAVDVAGLSCPGAGDV